jgi:hypothetical protein
MAEIADANARAHPRPSGVVGWHWKWPVLVASAAFVALLGAVVGIHAMFGERLILDGEQTVLGMGDRIRTDVTVCFVAAYTLGAGLFGLGMATREFDRLRTRLNLTDSEQREFRDRLFPGQRALCTVALVGAAVGVITDMLPFLSGVRTARDVSFLGIPFMGLLFALLGMQALTTIRQSQVFREVGRRHIELDLLDLSSLSPFSVVGLANAGYWFIGSAIASLLVTSDANMWIVGGVIAVTLGLGIVGLILPSRGVHQHIRERKREELARIRQAIASEREGLFSSGPVSSPAPRMPSLLAYEARIESVREWPFDTTTVSRFGFFLLIPLVSWVGGALVERVVDAALQ